MDDILEGNLRALKDCHSELFELLMSGETLESDFSHGVVVSSENVDGREVLFGVRDEQLYLLDSAGPGDPLADTWEKNLNAGTESKYFILGLGNGMFPRRILKKLHNNGVLVIYEPDLKLFTYVIEKYDVSDVLRDSRLTLLYPQLEVEQTKDLFHTMGKLLEYTDIDSLVLSDCPNYRKLYPAAWEYLSKKKTEIVSAMVANRSVMSRFGRAFVENTFANLLYFKESRSVSSLLGRLPVEVPAIIVSSGPSLNKNISELKTAVGHALIISADSAVSVLLAAGITPDMFFCVDAKKNPGHFKHEGIGNIALGCELDTTDAAFGNRNGLCFFAADSNPHINSFLENNGVDLPELESGGSVANAATDFAIKLGARRIILVGQDLAYTGDKSHAEGSLRASWNMDLSINECYIEGQNGEKVRSSNEFVKYRDWFERVIAKETGVDFINATEGGAKIRGTRQLPLGVAVSKYCTCDFDADIFLETADHLLNDDIRNAFDIYMDNLNEEVDCLGRRIDEGLRCYTEMYKLATDNKQGNSRFKKLYDKTREVGSILNTSGAMYYIENMVQEEMTGLMDKHSQDRKSEKSQLLADIESGIEYFKLVQKGVSEFRRIRQQK